MARTRRVFGNMREEIRRRVRETDADASYWSDAQILDFFNQAKDYREMQLQESQEGWSTEVYVASLVADQKRYSIPTSVARIKRVLHITQDGRYEIPLFRNERYFSDLDQKNVGSDVYYRPTYRIEGQFIVLEPTPPAAETNALRIEAEAPSEPFDADTDQLPLAWPLYTETLLILDTVVAMLDNEQAQGSIPPGALTSYEIERRKYEQQWLDYIESRSEGLVIGTKFSLGA